VQCYRLYDRNMPEYNAAIDIYGHHIHVQEYLPPNSIDEKKSSDRFDIILQLMKTTFPEMAGLHVKTRKKQKGKQQYTKQGQQQTQIEITEGNISALVNLDNYLDTGLFLDHRPIRLWINRHSKGKRFLNLFCYTGLATLHAAEGGAKKSVSVDLSPVYIQWAKANLALNGFNEANHRFIRADVMQWMESCKEQFDLIFIDPPTFSNSKKTRQDFDIQRDHVKLLDIAMKRLEPGGQLIFSNNFKRFQLDQALTDRYEIEEITSQTIPPDFSLRKGKPVHRCWKITRSPVSSTQKIHFPEDSRH
jgi:23S rRNA (guanine2445-N2)-methyltransferase / 23S rRNA (guanine2069-N7)-methyltransferase